MLILGSLGSKNPINGSVVVGATVSYIDTSGL